MAVYKGNLGFVEFLKFQDVATDTEQAAMDAAVNTEDWTAYQALISQVLGVNLK
jgi:hypothetical protein